MLYYVIKTTDKILNKKTGKEWINVSYYQRTSGVAGLYFNCMSNLTEAKQFDCKSEAKRTAARLFRKGRYEIVKIETHS